MKKENQSDLQEIDRKLSVLISLLAHQAIEGKTLVQGAPILRRLGLKASEIAVIFNSTVNTVNVQLTLAKKKRIKPKGDLTHGKS